MKRVWMLVVMVAVAVATVGGQQAPVRGGDRVRLETAINREVIDGDLAGAMAIYRALSESTERDVKAQAILRLGQAYKRTGNPQATRTLERALEFTDVPAVVTGARAALGRSAEGQATSGGVKTLMVNNRATNIAFPAVSPDGRLLAYTDYNGEANVVVRDLATGLSRTVTGDGAAPGKEAYWKSFSRDGRWLAYQFDAGNTSQIRLLDLGGQEVPSPRVLVSQTDRFVTPFDWSSDGKRLAAQITGSRQHAAQVGYVTLGDGQFHVIRSIQWLGSSRLSMSPDGAFLAYDNRAEDSGERDIYVVSTDGTAETPIGHHRGNDTVVGWSVDGRHLLFLSEKDGTTALYAQAMRNGRPNGNAVLLRKEVTGAPAGITSAGDVLLVVDPSTEAIHTGTFDRSSGKVTLGRTKPIRGLRPDWIGSGSIAHAVERSRSVLAVTTPATGKTREMTLSELQYLQGFSVGPDGRSVIAKGAGVQSGGGLFLIDLGSGDVKPVALTPGQPKPELWQVPTWWKGTSSVAYLRVRTNAAGRGPGIREAGPDEPKYVERDLATGEVRELFSFGQDPWATFDVSPSPDRRFLASRSPGRGEAAGARARAGAFTNDSKSYIYLHTLATGESRKLWDAPFSRAFAGAPQWLPDNSGVIVTRYTDADLTRLEAWLVPADGAAPRKLDLGVQNLLPAGVRISPDGRQLLMMVGDRRDGEIQAIERIVPGPKR